MTAEQNVYGTTFFHEMPAMQSIRQITDLSHYRDVPSDWLVALTDVMNSTHAIQNGRYKAVNTCGAVTIVAILNNLPNIDVPFLFGGDGAAVVIPPHVRQQAEEALVAVKRLAKQSFNLDLRVGIVPVADCLARGYEFKVGKIHLSDNFQQPVFTGGGLDCADSLLKSPIDGEKYQVIERGGETADFTGFECRWSKHPASNEEVVSLLVKAVGGNVDSQYRTYEAIMTEIQHIYGEHHDRHPINFNRMMVSTRLNQFRNEIGWKNPDYTLKDLLKLMGRAVGGFLLWRYISKIWDRYKATVYSSTDHEKFDDMIRMTISGTVDQRKALQAYLSGLQSDHQVVFGIHVSSHSLMTCIVFDRFGRQVHFVDGDDGGYAVAALELKRQMKEFNKRLTSEIPLFA